MIYRRIVNIRCGLRWLYGCVIFAGLLLSAPSGSFAVDRHYTELLSRAIAEIDMGEYNAAVKTLDEAFVLEPAEPVGRIAMATALAHTRKVDLAVEEYEAVLAADPDNALAHYGLATCLLSMGKVEKAREHYALSSGSVALDTQAALAYVDYLLGRPKRATGDCEATGALILLLEASRLQKQGDSDGAHSLVTDIIGCISVRGYVEDHGAVVTMDRKSPIRFSGESLSRLPEMRVSGNRNLPKATGRMVIRPDAPPPPGTEFAVFQVDGTLAAMINREPFQFTWDTGGYTNGIHTINVSMQLSSGGTITGQARRYWVQNESPGKSRQLTGTEAGRLTEVLRRRIELRPSLTSLYYMAGKHLLTKGDRADAEPFLEKAAARDPDYLDTRSLLRQCYGRRGYTRIQNGSANSKRVALTFDDGPNSSTMQLLDILDEHNVKATFFVVGSQVEANPQVVKAMADRGHQVESHTYSHMNMAHLTKRDAERELLRCAAAIRDATGKASRYFRPPGGHLGSAAQEAAEEYGFTGVFWTVLCSKFEESTPGNMSEHVSSSINNGGIVLMHNGEDVTLKALPSIITSLRDKGYSFATLPGLMERR